MTEHAPTPPAAKRLVYKAEELWRKREGFWDERTMVSVTSPEGAALRALQLASPEKVADAQRIAIEPLKNETLPKFKAACKVTTEKPRGDDKDDAGLVEIPAGDRSPPHEPTLPTPVTTTVENGGAKVAMSEAEGPKTETTPLAAMGRKRGRRPGRQLSPERMRIVLDSLRESPFLFNAARKAGIHRKTLEYWIKRSEAGDAGYDIEWQGLEWRFHEHCESAIQEAHDRVRVALWDATMGRIIYKTDKNGNRVALGFRGPCTKKFWKMFRFLLELLRPEKWGKHRKINVPHNTGVLVVGGTPHDIPNKVNKGTAASVKARKWKAGLRMIQETEV